MIFLYTGIVSTVAGLFYHFHKVNFLSASVVVHSECMRTEGREDNVRVTCKITV